MPTEVKPLRGSYRKKPVVIQAFLWSGRWKDYDQLLEFMPSGDWRLSSNGRVIIETLEGSMTADAGDYIIRGVKGEFYPCKADVFNLTYDEVPADAVE